MISYYGCLWLVSLLNLVWCFVQAWECTLGKEMAWNILSLFTTSGMLFLEVSLLAFLLQGNHASGLQALTWTFVISGLFVGLDLLLKAIYLFGFGVPLFIDNSEHPRQIKWGLWVVHRLVLTAIYGSILFMYHSKWRERLYSATIVCYHAFCLPLLYITFLADFFEEEDMRLENVYYSEMKDASFFDADWE
ncbi:hypothetical protein ES288_D10G232700v1 [Gossypium darwinii]|uniref:Uncharacterized protein n=1 Tax=Gossypium darwinii TaxID=34276 RepID=A0A5D2B6M7_GOSDA|nr:hypothetical protein ES288_D10G232700v1 [Gossypium darwinii]